VLNLFDFKVWKELEILRKDQLMTSGFEQRFRIPRAISLRGVSKLGSDDLPLVIDWSQGIEFVVSLERSKVLRENPSSRAEYFPNTSAFIVSVTCPCKNTVLSTQTVGTMYPTFSATKESSHRPTLAANQVSDSSFHSRNLSNGPYRAGGTGTIAATPFHCDGILSSDCRRPVTAE
jgi:hypothetical protein